jgi:hypothetical protein
MMHIHSFGIWGFLVLIADIYAVLNIFIFQAPVENLNKAVWAALVLVLPVAGFLLWLLFGPRGRGFA